VLAQAGASGISQIVSRFVPEAEALGYAPLSARYAHAGTHVAPLPGSAGVLAVRNLSM
jgi:hypothetical protein